MPGDSHSRSAHRASPAGGLASLNPQLLVRQAQASRARARQAIIRQAVARRTAKLEAAQSRAAPSRAAHSWSTSSRAAHSWAGAAPAAHSRAGATRAAHFRDPSFPAVDFRGGDRPVHSRAIPKGQASAQHRQPRVGQSPGVLGPQRQTQQGPQSLMRGLGALIVMAIIGLSAFFVFAEERRGDGRESAAPPGAEPGIASRQLDSEPLTQLEVFPGPSVHPQGAAGYQVSMTHSDSECRIATTGELGALLEDYGCDQVVRARLTAPYGGYQVTTGIFNLADATGAGQVSELTGILVEAGRGSFATLGGTAGDPLAEPLAQVGWHSRGHYLLYCVVARPDGQLVTDDDPYAARITAELVEGYLGDQVIGQRTLDP